MKKLFLVLFAITALSMSACKDDQTTPPTGEPPVTQPPTGDSEPDAHEKPFYVSEDGKKWGSAKQIDEKSFWTKSGFGHDKMPLCTTQKVGDQCTKSSASCMIDKNNYLDCRTSKTYKVWGWVYEKQGKDFKPLEGVSLDIFDFAFCMVGGCDILAGPVLTDKWGYFEIITPTLKDTLRINGKAGYYGLCHGKKPINGGGTYLTDKEGKATLGGVQYKLKENSCVNGFPE